LKREADIAPKKRKTISARSDKSVKRNKITVLLDTSQSDLFEAYCRDRGYKKSTLVARLIREYLASEGFDEQAKEQSDR
jgi:hypothetical protein